MKFKDVEQFIEEKSPLRIELDNKIKQIRDHIIDGAPEVVVDIPQLVKDLIRSYHYKTPMNWFVPEVYNTFEDWFLRRLKPSVLQTCIKNSEHSIICSPVEGKIRKQALDYGDVIVKKSVIAAAELKQILEADEVLQISLIKPDYHRVHSPVDGIVEKIKRYDYGELFKNSEAMTIFTINTDIGKVTMAAVGEVMIQSFVTDLQEGDEVFKVREIGYFNFGSQIILGFPKGLKNVSYANQKVFVGDTIIQKD